MHIKYTRLNGNRSLALPLVEQELLTLPDHPNSPPVLVGFELIDHQVYVYAL
jgi:hypothetical protein